MEPIAPVKEQDVSRGAGLSPVRTNTLSWLPVGLLAGMIAVEGWYLAPSLFRAWYFSSDEYVFVAEVIRFLHLDFRQHFFDMPGTPLMILTATIWVLIFLAETALGLAPLSGGLEDFTFHRLPLLFSVMRAETLLFTLVSIVLVFLIASRVMNRAGACVAALVLMMSPTYSSYSSFIRVESLSMCFILASALCVLRALESHKASQAGEASDVRWILCAGGLAGLAAATRFHSVTASLPLLLLLLLIDRQRLPDYSPRLRLAWKYTLGLGCAAACATAIAIKTGLLPNSEFGKTLTSLWANVFGSIYTLALLTAALSAGVLAVSRLPRSRWLADRVQHPRILVLLAGYILGGLAGTPMIVTQYRYFLQSISSYNSSYFDLDRANWPLLQNIAWYLKFYLRLIAPDAPTVILLVIGAILILVRRDKLMLPFLLSGLLFFFSKPLTLLASPHHIILWLPFYGMVAGFAAAWAWDTVPTRIRHGDSLKQVGLAALVALLGTTMVPGPRIAASNARLIEGRMGSIALATDWIHKNAEPGALVAISYFCFNSDVFFSWLRSLEVPGPAAPLDGPQYTIWWGEHSALRGRNGYVCAAPLDRQFIKQTMDLRRPGEGTDPFADNGFRLASKFGTGLDEIDVFRFDFADRAAPP